MAREIFEGLRTCVALEKTGPDVLARGGAENGRPSLRILLQAIVTGEGEVRVNIASIVAVKKPEIDESGALPWRAASVMEDQHAELICERLARFAGSAVLDREKTRTKT